MKRKLIPKAGHYLLVCLLILLGSYKATSQTLSTVGTDFWLGFMENTGNTQEELRLFITSQSATSGSVSIPLLGWSTNFTVVPNVTTTVIVPLLQGETTSNDVVDSKGIHVTTNDPVSLFAINFSTYTADASKILPTSSLGTEYVVSAYRGISSFTRSEMLITATEDNTEIEITPSVSTLGGHPAGVSYLINLDQGETYQVKSLATTDDLSGTIVAGTNQSGSCRPFAVFGGAQCANVPTTCSTCDHLFDQQFPVYAWGTEYYVPPFQSTGVYTYRVLAKDNGTQISVDGAAPFNLNAGQIYEINNEVDPKQITSNLPVQVVQMMQGDNCSQNGDPAMLILNPNDQQISNITFGTVSSTVITNHFLNIIVESSNIGSVLLDNVPIPSANFAVFPTNPATAYVQVSIPQGSHNLYAPNGFTAYVYGMGTAESYAYSLGAYKDAVVLTVDSVICTTTTTTLVPPISLFTPEWYAASDPTTILGTGNSLTLTAPVQTDVYTIEGISPMSGCPESYNFSVSGLTPPTIDIEISEDTVCAFSSVNAVVTTSDFGFYDYSWWPAYAFSDPANDSTVVLPPSSGWYGVTVSNVGGGCVEVSDSVYIHVNSSNIQSLNLTTSDTLLCLGDSAFLEATANEILFFEEFSSLIPSPTWDQITGGVIGTTCGSVSGSAMLFEGGPVREAETQDFDVSSGGNLEFYLQVATGLAPCDDAEFGEDILLEYSTDGGVNWNPWTTLFEFNYPTATLVSLQIPIAAQTTSTRFRWSQPNYSGINEDVWWLDNVILTINGGSGQLNYTWTPSQSLSNPTSNQTYATPSASGWYTVEVGTGNCIYIDSVFIEVSDTITLDLLSDTVLCGNQTVTLEAVVNGSQDYTMSWGPPGVFSSISGPFATVNPNTDTTIYVNVDSPIGCFAEVDSVTIENKSVSINISGSSVVCAGEQEVLTANVTGNVPNYTIAWYQGTSQISSGQHSITINPLTNVSYTVEVTDQVTGCSWSEIISITIDNLSVDAGQDTLLCSTDQYELNGWVSTVNATHFWNNQAVLSNASDLHAIIQQDGTFQFILTASTVNCTVSDTVNIIHNPPVLEYLPEDTLVCQGTSLVIPFNGTLIWSNPSSGITSNPTSLEFQGNNSQLYSILYNTTNGCPVVDTIQVWISPSPYVELPADTTLCPGTIFNVIPSAGPFGGDFLWSTGSTNSTINVSSANTYWLNYSNQCGSVTDTIQIDYFTPYSLDLGADTTVCPETTVQLQPILPTGGSIIWSSGGTSMPFITGAGTIIGTADDGNGCLVKDTIVIDEHPQIQFNIPSQIFVCTGDSSTLDASSPQGQNYLWSTGEITPSIVVAQWGMYSVQITDAFGCTAEDSTEFGLYAIPNPIISGDTTYCSNESVSFSVQDSYENYLWNTGSEFDTAVITGIWNELTVEVWDTNGCYNTDTLELAPVIIEKPNLGEDIVLCDTTSVTLDASISGGQDYLWLPNGETAPTIDVMPGNYIVNVFIDGCMASDSISVAVKPFTLDLGEDQMICRDEPIFLNHSMYNIDSIVWSDGSVGSWYLEETMYLVDDSVWVGATAYGCEVQEDSLLIFFEDCNCQIYVPNAYSPDGDGINEAFKVYYECPIEDFELHIFNRWGEVVFDTKDPDFEWDGSQANGERVQDGVYTWQIRFHAEYLRDAEYKEMHGHVTILR